jgi:peptidyl-prolyl cis-trans isomerase D
LPPDQANALGLDRQVLNEMIAVAGLDQQARRMRLGISNSEIARRITTDPNLQTINGQFDRDRFAMVLHNMGYTEQRFVSERRQEALRRQIVDSIAGDAAAPKAWLDALNQFQNEQRSIDYVALGATQAGDLPQPTAAELEKFYTAHSGAFRAPEYRKIDAVTVTPTELAKWMNVSDDDIKHAYEDGLARFTTPERRHIEQIVFPNLADAQAASDRIKSGTGFAAIATERGLKPSDIDIGTKAKSGIVEPAVADAAFSLKEGEVSAPVQVPYGAVIVTVLKIEPSVTKSLADAAPQLRNDIALARAKAQVQDIHDKIEDARAGGSSIEEAAQKLKLPVVTYAAVDNFGHDPDGKPVVNLPHGSDVMNAAFSTEVGVDSDPIEADGGYVWYDVAAITPAQERPLDAVKDEVAQRWRNEQIAERLKAKAAALLDQLKGGVGLDTVAASSGVKVQSAKDFKRGGAVPGLSPRMVDVAFHTGKDAYGSAPSDDRSQWIVFRVTDVKTPARAPNSDDAKRDEQTVRRQLSDDLVGQYVIWLENSLGTTVNPGVLAQAMGNSGPDTN